MAGVSLGLGLGRPHMPPRMEISISLTNVDDENAETTILRQTAQFTISGTVEYDGEYEVVLADMDLGPVNVVPPQLSDDTVAGGVLTARPGLWAYDGNNAAPDISYRWYRDGEEIPNVDSSSYTVTVADEGHSISLKETAVDADGSRTVGSSILEIPVAVVTTISQNAGNVVNITTNEDSLSLTVSDTARFDGVYTVAIPDLVDPANLVAPMINGSPEVGQDLTAESGLWVYNTEGGAPAITYQWQRDGADIAGAIGTTYTLVAADQGASVNCVETAADSDGSRSAVSNAIAVPAAPSTTSYADTFDGYAEGAVLSDQAAYTRLAGSGTKATVSSGKLAVRSAGGAAETIRRAENLPANQFAEAALANTPDTSNRLYLYVRCSGDANYYRLRAAGGRYDVQKKVSGTESYVAGGYKVATSPAAGDLVRLAVTGDTLTFTLTRGGVDTVKTITDTSLTSGQPAVGFQNYGSVSAVAEVDQLTVGEV